MDENHTTDAGGGKPLLRPIGDKVVIVQVLIVIFLSINSLLIFTLFKKDVFYTNTRYILFGHTLLCDCLYLIITNILLLLSYFRISIPVWLCMISCFWSMVLTFLTPLTLTAMSLERYVAICMPLRHGELSTARRAIYCIFIIHSLSYVQAVVINSIFIAAVPRSFYTQYNLCSVELLIVHKWQSYVRVAISQFYFLGMSITVTFAYVKIVAVAREASADSKSSTFKGLKTVILHAFQLLLCLIQLVCPFIETAMLQIDLTLYINVRYFDYVAFNLAPRCLCPLVYGLRDEKFYCVFRYYALCAMNKNVSPVLVDI